MNILMAGIDFHKADVAQREPFSLTAAALARTLRQIRWQPGVDECLLISTCNRTELWVCGNQTDGTALSPVKLLCEARGLDETGYLPYFTVRQGMDAVRYLCELASGIHSQIFGDDQIISQVKDHLPSQKRPAYRPGRALCRYCVGGIVPHGGHGCQKGKILCFMFRSRPFRCGGCPASFTGTAYFCSRKALPGDRKWRDRAAHSR